jgi:hypothetical protein
MKSVNRLSLVAIVFVAFFLTIGAFISDLHAEEKIHSFHSDITVNRDGSLTITEAITVSVENVQIKHGIYRDFPTSYRDRFGRIKTVPFDVISATRDGDPERWFIKKLKNGVRVYMGNRSVTIPRGKYTYTLTYRTDHQLGFFESHDEIYWNVNGNDWPFRMEKVSARVRLPQEVPPDSILVDGFTGAYGSKGKDFDIYLDENGSVNFETTRAFRKKEGLTIVVAWSPGFIARPTLRESVFLFTRQNAEMVVGGGGLIVLLLYYLVAWFILGRDPATGTIVPLFEPPGDITPGAIRYLNRMKYDHHAFASDIISLAVKGFIRSGMKGKTRLHWRNWVPLMNFRWLKSRGTWLSSCSRMREGYLN